MVIPIYDGLKRKMPGGDRRISEPSTATSEVVKKETRQQLIESGSSTIIMDIFWGVN